MKQRKYKHDTKKEAAALLEWINKEKGIYLGEFAYERGYHRKMFGSFCERCEVFSDAFDQAKQWQENKLVFNGLNRAWESSFTRFVMARVCDPIWKQSWDKDPEQTDKTVNVVVQRLGAQKEVYKKSKKPKK